jgi:hypothetical protein
MSKLYIITEYPPAGVCFASAPAYRTGQHDVVCLYLGAGKWRAPRSSRGGFSAAGVPPRVCHASELRSCVGICSSLARRE